MLNAKIDLSYQFTFIRKHLKKLDITCKEAFDSRKHLKLGTVSQTIACLFKASAILPFLDGIWVSKWPEITN